MSLLEIHCVSNKILYLEVRRGNRKKRKKKKKENNSGPPRKLYPLPYPSQIRLL